MPMACKHPPARLYSWWATGDDGIPDSVLVIVCLDCHVTLQGAITRTPEEIDADKINILQRKPIRELRKMQRLVIAQIERTVCTQKNEAGILSLQGMDREIAAAIDFKEFA